MFPANLGTEKRRLSGQVLVRLTEQAEAAVAAAAAAAGISAAAWARRRDRHGRGTA